MSIYAISDLHLSFNTNKPMDIFGWENYEERIKKNWLEKVNEKDLVLLPGDFSWEMKLENTYKDFEFINNLPGKKLLLKGNHDYWWTTVTSMRKFLKENKFQNITDLFADVLEKDMKNNYNSLQKFDNQIFIYPYEYFYPIDYEWIGKSFTDNTKAVYYEKNRKVPKKAKIKIKMAKKYGVESFNYFFSTLRTVKNNLGYKKYIMSQNIKKKFSVKEDPGIDTAKEKLQEYARACS